MESFLIAKNFMGRSFKCEGYLLLLTTDMNFKYHMTDMNFMYFMTFLTYSCFILLNVDFCVSFL